MSATQIAVLCSLAGAASLIATIGLLHGPAPRRRRVGIAEQGIAEQVIPRLPSCPIGRPQQLPLGPLTVAEAHELMQRHRVCAPSECVYKNVAFRTLIEAGYMRDPRANRS
ncbi:hypothetical protein [Nocardia sp. R6R-6]|uniref:hypothetical protein n=1 Tax=Nocardia sp. R6R-6 TaxID=3459303 RepID=UPI00403D8466